MLQDAFELVGTVKQLVPIEIKQYYWAALDLYLTPSLWAFFAIILIWERVRPADPAQRLLSRGLGQDFIWYNVDLALNVALVPAFAGAIRFLYDRAFGGQLLALTPSWPVPLKIALAVTVYDLLFWVKHRMIHRVETLWFFHSIHHSQREMNVLTDRRQHVFEHLLSQVAVYLPLIALGLQPVAVMAVGAALWWHSLFLHANIRVNLGWLNHVLITPQYHRVHHSIEPRHQNKNFGTLVTFWDRMSGVMYPHFDEYPPTGVEGVDFPPPRLLKPQTWIGDIARQTWYPIRKALRLG
jgi:sterol desaturase/sphingolipid hydroxylase (fatty acid hydroxylase superfamily)